MVKFENLDTLLKALLSPGGLLAISLLYLTTVIGFVLKFISDRINAKDKENFQLSSKINQELWQNRLIAYKEVWSQMARFSLRPPQNVELDDMKNFQIFLRDWYFRSGIFLTEESYNKFIVLQDQVIEAIKDSNKWENQNAENPPWGEVQKFCSRLRKSFANDIRSRKGITVE